MVKNKKIVVIMPAYNAAKTLQKTYDEVMEQGIVDLVILVDDASNDETSAIASSLPNTQSYVHRKNKGVRDKSK
jgi:glycosyltransferase involved in cell wall biosynthesis